MTKSKQQKKLAKDRLKVWIDGACEPVNPGGTASYGVVVKHQGKVLFSECKVIGEGLAMSNNVAEYSGLIAFLEWYIPLEAGFNTKRRPVIYSDCRLLINQMDGEWRALRGLYLPYYKKARNLILQNNLDLSFWWVPREQNEEADALSKEALVKAGIQLAIQPVQNKKSATIKPHRAGISLPLYYPFF